MQSTVGVTPHPCCLQQDICLRQVRLAYISKFQARILVFVVLKYVFS